MTNQNPFQPPVAELAEPTAPDSRSGAYLLIGLVAAQFLATLFLAPTYFEFVKTGMASGLALLLWVPGSGCLYAGALLQLSKRQRGKYLFLVAAVCLGLSVRLWAWSYALAIVAAFGAAVGAFGWWLVYKKEKANAKPWHAEA
jgi:hypothetical protein